MSAPIEKTTSESSTIPSHVLADIDAVLARVNEELTARYLTARDTGITLVR